MPCIAHYLLKKIFYICLAMLNIVTKTTFPNGIIN